THAQVEDQAGMGLEIVLEEDAALRLAETDAAGAEDDAHSVDFVSEEIVDRVVGVSGVLLLNAVGLDAADFETGFEGVASAAQSERVGRGVGIVGPLQFAFEGTANDVVDAERAQAA